MKLIDLNALKYFYANLVEVLKGKADVADTNAHISDKSNPHEVTKTQVGLSKVENKSSSEIRSEITSGNVTDALGYTPLDAVGVQLNGKDLAKDSNNKINISITADDVSAISYATTQTLTEAQKAQARANIGAGEGIDNETLKAIALSLYTPKSCTNTYTTSTNKLRRNTVVSWNFECNPFKTLIEVNKAHYCYIQVPKHNPKTNYGSGKVLDIYDILNRYDTTETTCMSYDIEGTVNWVDKTNVVSQSFANSTYERYSAKVEISADTNGNRDYDLWVGFVIQFKILSTGETFNCVSDIIADTTPELEPIVSELKQSVGDINTTLEAVL